MDPTAESRARLILDAQRQALVQDMRRARRSLPSGIVLIVLGAALATTGLVLPLTVMSLVFIVGLGMMMIPFGIAVLARAWQTLTAAPRKLRELDELAPARVVGRR